ncbi:hypothetical protein LSCM1_06073 [Leishmania martiniquensis]|uniref:Uncharacterized protein n=1 Tax=Leishmania martiniquensis TaxID=1580590 RepID=A0A836KK38_9TRYP|nr:hypothetical protein LSCM1_06073 [Leishmania martiniquensis]
MPSLHQRPQRQDSIAKPLLRSSVSCASLSDCARGLTEDTGGVTRSSLTQVSLPYDSCSRTWSSSFSASGSGAPMRSPPRVHVTPSLLVSPAKKKAAAVLAAEPALAAACSWSQVLPMDVFDLVLAQDAQQRPAQQQRQRRLAKGKELKGESSEGSVPGAVPMAEVADEATPNTSFTLLSGAVGVLRRPSCPRRLLTCKAACGEAASAATHPLASAAGRRSACALPHHQPGCLMSPVLGLPLPYGATGDPYPGSAGDHNLSFAAPLSTREERLRHLRALLRETHRLQEALWQQLCEMQRGRKSAATPCTQQARSLAVLEVFSEPQSGEWAAPLCGVCRSLPRVSPGEERWATG